MHLTPRELDKLMIHTLADVALKRKAKGLKLNHPETVAVLSAAALPSPSVRHWSGTSAPLSAAHSFPPPTPFRRPLLSAVARPFPWWPAPSRGGPLLPAACRSRLSAAAGLYGCR